MRSAVALTADNRARLAEVAKALTGREVDLIEHVDASLLAGMVVRIGDRQYDMSAASRLQRIRTSLVQRAAQEAHGGRSFVEGSAA